MSNELQQQILRVSGPFTRPEIQINERDLPDMVGDVVEALRVNNNPIRLFTRNGRLCTVELADNGTYEVRALTIDSLRHLASNAANFVRVNAKGEWKPAILPLEICRDILYGGQTYSAFPPLIAVTETPLVSPDGVIESHPGYLRGTKMFFGPREGDDFHVERIPPTHANVQQAKKEIFGYLFDGFPFDGKASKVNALALALQPIIRHLIDGPTPLFVVDAPTRGSGKSLLVQTAATITNPGRFATKVAPRDDSEYRKVITASLRTGNQHIFFDNVKTHVDSSSLCAAITSTTWEDRLLQQSSNVTLPNMSTFVMTGNNISLDDEVTTRCVSIRLDPKCEQPEKRSGFKCSNPTKEVRDNRRHYLALLLCLVDCWIKQGMPLYSGPAGFRYGAWLGVMGGILESIGAHGFIENYDSRTQAANPDHEHWVAFVANWGMAHGTKLVTVRDGLVEFAYGSLKSYGDIDKPGPLIDILPCATARSRPAKLGKALAERVDRVFGDWRIKKGPLTDGVPTFQLERV